MKNDKEFLGKEPVGKLLFQLALPAITAQIINLLYNMVDRIFIGHIPGEGAMALTGVGVCLPIIMVVSAFAELISMGGAPRASIAMGKKDEQTAQQILGNCFWAQIIISVILTLILLIWNRPLLLQFGASANTIDYAADYMSVYAIGTVFVQLTLGMNAFITAQGFAKTGMLTVLIGAICNIILDPVLIFGAGMGVRGAALATIISQAVSTIWVLIFLRGKKTFLHLRPCKTQIDIKLIFSCLGLGVAPFIMQASESIIIVCFNASLLKYGGDVAVGAMTILSTVMQFSMLPTQGLGQGAQPIISYNFGARDAERVKKTYVLLLKASFLYAIAVWALVMIFPKAVAGIFSTDQELIRFTGWALRIYIAMVFMMGIQTACQMTFISIGNAKASVVVAVVRKFVLLLPLIYLLPHLFADKTMAVYLAEPVSDFLAVTFTIFLFRSQFRKVLERIRD